MNLDHPLAHNRAGREYDKNRVTPKKVSTEDYYQILMLARVGPDPEGKVDIPIKTPVSVGLYERVRIAAWLVTEQYIHDVKRFEKDYANRRNSLEQAYQKWEVASEANRPKLAQEWRAAKNGLDELIASNREKLDMTSRCAEEKLDRTCLVVMLPRFSTRPALALTPLGNQDRVKLRVRSRDMNPDDVVEARIMVDRRRLWLARLSPTAIGEVDETVTLAVGRRPRTSMHICAVARILNRPSPKPPSPSTSESLVASTPSKNKPKKLNTRCGVPWQPWDLTILELTLPDP
jgi:hypothetical protein